LPEGPEVEIHTALPGKTREIVGDILARWISQGYCRINDILILSPHRFLSKTGLAGCTRIAAWPLVDHE
jgi:hypothetical protein